MLTDILKNVNKYKHINRLTGSWIDDQAKKKDEEIGGQVNR
jgi:hypothetical protein